MTDEFTATVVSLGLPGGVDIVEEHLGHPDIDVVFSGESASVISLCWICVELIITDGPTHWVSERRI